jgi:hypothetical protein
MHRLIVRAPPGMTVDHKNRDPLDNRRANLRLCDGTQNNANGAPGRGVSKYRGISRRPCHARPWRAEIQVRGKRYYLGSFATEVEAAAAYDVAAVMFFGPFAHLNLQGHGSIASRQGDPSPEAGARMAASIPINVVLPDCDGNALGSNLSPGGLVLPS